MPSPHAGVVPARLGDPTAVAVGVLLIAVVLAAWWPAALLAVAAGAFVLGRRDVRRRVLLGGVLVGTVVRTVVGTVRGEALPTQLAGVVALWLVVVVADGLGRLVLARVRYREQGWQLAEALHGRELAVAETARTAERSRIAGEMHDSLGHDMALLAMQLAALQVQVQHGGIPAADLTGRLRALRSQAATATERLHEVISLLEPAAGAGPAGAPVPRPAGPAGAQSWSGAVEALVQRSRGAGLEVELASTGSGLDRCSAVVGSTVLRVVEEALTNTAKHAPGAPLELGIEVAEHTVRVRAVNPRHGGPRPPHGDQQVTAPGSGRGLSQLAERTRALGGSWRVTEGAGRFTLSAEIPTRPVAVAVAVDVGGGPVEPATARSRSREAVTGRWQSAVVLPAAVLASAGVVLALSFVVVTVASVLPRERFAALEVGQPEAVAAALLPPWQMPDAPQRVAESSEDCRYYEERVSFFERVTTFQVCFADGAVLTVTEIPAGMSR